MQIADVDSDIKKMLTESKISSSMRSLESCEWIVYEKQGKKIVGAVGIGGIFHTSSIQINEDFRSQGIGKRIQTALVNEAKKRNYSFITVFVDPRNEASTKLHNSVGYKTIFRINYSKEIIQDVKIIILKPKGKIIKKILTCFNTKIGIFFLACTLKITRPLFKRVLGYNEENIPLPSIKEILGNFEKI